MRSERPTINHRDLAQKEPHDSRACRPFKNEVFRELERVGKALGNQRRLELLELLSQRPRNVESLAEELGLSVASTSQHLQRLKQARLIVGRRDGNYIFYELMTPKVGTFYAIFRSLATRQLPTIEAAVSEFLDPENLLSEDVSTLIEGIERGEFLLLDARPKEEFLAGHVEGAWSVPVANWEAYLDKLPREQRIVAYCRGPFCAFADELVKRLRTQGFQAHRVDLGIADFRQLDLRIVAN